ncbi:chromate transporter [Metamycoplasma cloacale]|uniref:Chromate transporter n=1 Tax=Metamycoplasma cloacale TaxID=92401 RepID=A0A2Z4LMT6_9BACT|nr:chromate transporter [Metamycoplasma cloacale]AWX42964.1 chromate transporter [Metamycoplasma cloacale]
MISALLLSIPLLIFISLAIFGGGQVFMPVFQWMWKLLDSLFQCGINQELIDNIFSVSNATPGVISTKFGLITGFIVAKGEWWGYIAMFLTFLVFVIPPIIVMHFSMKKVNKIQNNVVLKRLFMIMNPVVAGIIAALVFQLILSTMFPYIMFNESAKQYMGIIEKENSSKVAFFSGWRAIALYVWVPLGITFSSIASWKKVPIWAIIIINLQLTFLVFQPWIK